MGTLGLDPDRVSVLDEHGHRKTVIPAEVRGPYRRMRTQVHTVLILFFLVLPWITINGHQALHLNIPGREFIFFGLKLYAHDAPLIFFILAILTLGLAFVTAVWGRFWCGWACPQTVFIDTLFRRIEIWIEGNYIQRRRNQTAPLTPQILVRRILKWTAFFVLSSLIAHSFAAYFVGASELRAMMAGSPFQNWSYFLWISAFTAAILFDFGWFREQFCIIMCPYGRFQGLLMDSKSMAVLYDEKRGEPRKGAALAQATNYLRQADVTTPLAKDAVPAKVGDCVNCRRCVEVCPVGIDIRKGLQLECIACTACMDACDEIMVKVKKPKGLIRYANLEGGVWSLKSPRALLYLALILLSAGGLAWSLAGRSALDATLLRGQGALFTQIQTAAGEPALTNQLRLHVKNQAGRDLKVELRAETLGGVPLAIATSQNPVDLKAGDDKTLYLFVQFSPSVLEGASEVPARIWLKNLGEPEFQIERSFKLLGPSPTATDEKDEDEHSEADGSESEAHP